MVETLSARPNISEAKLQLRTVPLGENVPSKSSDVPPHTLSFLLSKINPTEKMSLFINDPQTQFSEPLFSAEISTEDSFFEFFGQESHSSYPQHIEQTIFEPVEARDNALDDFEKAEAIISANLTTFNSLKRSIFNRAAALQAGCCPPGQNNGSIGSGSVSGSFIGDDGGEHKSGKHEHCGKCGGDLENNGACSKCS